MESTRTPSVVPLTVTGGGPDLTVAFPPGTRLTESNADDVGRRLAALVEGRDHPLLTLDLSGVEMLTSFALGKLVALNGRVRAAGGRLTLAAPTTHVRQALKVTRLDTVLAVSDARPVEAA